jgi:hypothetical protein
MEEGEKWSQLGRDNDEDESALLLLNEIFFLNYFVFASATITKTKTRTLYHHQRGRKSGSYNQLHSSFFALSTFGRHLKSLLRVSAIIEMMIL